MISIFHIQMFLWGTSDYLPVTEHTNTQGKAQKNVFACFTLLNDYFYSFKGQCQCLFDYLIFFRVISV